MHEFRSRFGGLQEADYALPPEVLARTPSPALVVHLGRVRENVRRVIAACGSADRWRPHVKTTKIAEVWAELVRSGVRRFKCATTREAQVLLEVLEQESVRGDVLLAYPLIGPSLERLGQLADHHTRQRVSVLCEDPAALASIPSSLGVFIDVDPGMNRTGVPAAEEGTILAIAAAAAERFRGVHFYDGHLHGADEDARRREIQAGYTRLLELITALTAAGQQPEEAITSGTPAFLHALDDARLAALEGTHHTVSPGTVVYHDLRSEQENSQLDLTPAAVVLTRVVSHPGGGFATCDAGSKALAAEAGDPVAYAIGHPELVATPPNEEHLPFAVTSGARPARGTVLYLVPMHVCPTVNLAEEALLVDGDDIRIVDVVARAHEIGWSPELAHSGPRRHLPLD